MITNERQYKITRSKTDAFQRSLEELFRQNDTPDILETVLEALIEPMKGT